MKITTQKKVKKHLKFYAINFGFRKPYQVLLDGTICQAALKNQVNIRSQFPKYLDGEAKLLTTPCVLIEMEKIGKMMYGAMVIVKQFGYHKCGHERNPIGASDCLLSMLGEKNTQRYILATQDPALRAEARRIPGTPVIYLHAKTPVFEEPSRLSQRLAHDAGQAKFLPPPLVPTADEAAAAEPKKKRKKKGGPNSLSCKKKKKKVLPRKPVAAAEGDEPKRKRKRVKLAKHLKEIKREWLGHAPGPSAN